MRVAVGLSFRIASKTMRNKWRGAVRAFLSRLRASAAAAAQRIHATGEGGSGGRHSRHGDVSDRAADSAGDSPLKKEVPVDFQQQLCNTVEIG